MQFKYGEQIKALIHKSFDLSIQRNCKEKAQFYQLCHIGKATSHGLHPWRTRLLSCHGDVLQQNDKIGCLSMPSKATYIDAFSDLTPLSAGRHHLSGPSKTLQITVKKLLCCYDVTTQWLSLGRV